MTTLTGIFWNGTGLLCVFSLVRLYPRLRGQLRGAGWKAVCATLILGGVAGIVGAVGGFFLVDIFLFDPLSDVRLVVRGIFIILAFILGAGLAGFVAGRALPKICRQDATVTAAIMACVLLILHPIAYGWFAISLPSLLGSLF